MWKKSQNCCVKIQNSGENIESMISKSPNYGKLNPNYNKKIEVIVFKGKIMRLKSYYYEKLSHCFDSSI